MRLADLYVCLLLIAGCICQDKKAPVNDHLLDTLIKTMAEETDQLPGQTKTTETPAQEAEKPIPGTNLDTKKNVMFDPISIKLLRGEENGIIVSDLSPSQPMYLLNQTSLKVYSVDYHYKKRLIFFTALNKTYRYEVVGRLMRASEPQVVVGVGVDSAVSLAVDWVHDKLYWMTEKYQTVEMADLDGSNRTLLIDNLQNNTRFPNNIALDPYKGYLFFVNNHTIYRTSLTGENLEKISLEGQGDRGVRCLALDTHKQRLYFSGKMKDFNGGQPYLASSDYNGLSVKNHPLTNKFNDIFSLAVYEDTLYFANYRGKNKPDSIFMINLSLSPVTPVQLWETNSLWNLRVYHPGVQRSPAKEEERTTPKSSD